MKSLSPTGVRLVFPPMQVIRYEGQLYDYRGRARDRQRRHIFEADDKLRVDFADDELLGLQHEQKLEVLGRAEAESVRLVADGRKPRPNFDSATPEERAAAERILKYIRKWEVSGCPPRTKRGLTPLIRGTAQAERDPAPPSTRTLCRKLAAWIESGGDIASLLPATSMRGNNQDRLDTGLKIRFRQLIEKYYLADEPETVVGAHALARVEWDELHQHLAEADRPPFPSLDSAYAAVREIDLFTQDYCRKGKAVAHHNHAPVDSGPIATRHNECWEMDHTVLDVIVIDEDSGLPIGRPTLTVAIDRHSRAIPAFHVGWDAPGIQPVIECLRKGISLKEELLARVPDLRNPYPVCGVPDEIVTDNGAEFRSKAFKEICGRLGIETSRSPVLKAWYRGRIERVIKTIVHSTCHKVPGSTFANFFERNRERIPEKVAVCTLAELDAMITRFIVDIYHVRRHRTLNDSPIRLWNQSVAHNGMKPLPDPRKLAVTLSLLYFRRPQRYGIQFEGLLYDSPQLALYRTLKGVPQIVSVKVDPNDLTRIWYMDSTVNDYVELRVQRSMRERLQGVTLDLHKMARALQRNNPELLTGEAGISKAHGMIRRSLEEGVRGRDGLKNRRRAMRALDKLRKKAASMYEDAPAIETEGEDDLVDELLGSEDAILEDDAPVATSEAAAASVELTAAAGSAGAVEASPVVADSPQEFPKTRRPRSRAAAPRDIPGEPPAHQDPPASPSALPDDEDDFDDISAGVKANLFRNNERREKGDV